MWCSIFWNMGVNRSFGRVRSVHLSVRTCFSGTLVRTLHGVTFLVILTVLGNLVSRVLVLWEEFNILLPWRWRQNVQQRWYLFTDLYVSIPEGSNFDSALSTSHLTIKLPYTVSYPEDGGGMFVWNVGTFVPNDTALRSRRLSSWCPPLSKHKISTHWSIDSLSVYLTWSATIAVVCRLPECSAVPELLPVVSPMKDGNQHLYRSQAQCGFDFFFQGDHFKEVGCVGPQQGNVVLLS
jgi:hypothetical protein